MPASRSFALLCLSLFACGGGSGGESNVATNAPALPSPTATAPAVGDAGGPPAPVVLPPSGKWLGATPYEGGVEFRVWSPNAASAAVLLDGVARPLDKESGGYFGARIDGAKVGQRYRYVLRTGDGKEFVRIDPRARALDGADGVVVDPRSYAWKTPPFTAASRETAVGYELHVASFTAGPAGGTFDSAVSRLPDLEALGISFVELMPVNAHGGKLGWGYNPQHYFAPHPSFGSPDALRGLVDASHARGIGVVLDVVYNHYDGWKDAPLRCFDGCTGQGAGVYFFQDEPYRLTPWGPRPDFSNPAVSDFLADNVFAWMDEYRIDGFRHDSVSNVRAIDGQGTVPGGVEISRRMNEVAEARSPSVLLVAEDLKGQASITAARASGGLGYHTQWDGGFYWAITSAVTAVDDASRDLDAVASALTGSYNGDPFQRLLYVESHDTAGNDGARLPARIDPKNPTSLAARKRSMLAAGLLFTAPGVPMLFMGQEMLEATKFAASPAPLDWTLLQSQAGLRTFYRDMIRLRRNLDGVSDGLTSPKITVTHKNAADGNKVIVYRRAGSASDVMVVANLGGRNYTRYDIGLPSGGAWHARVDSNTTRYGADLAAAAATPVTVAGTPRDGLPFTGSVALGPYAFLVLTR